MGMGGRWKWNWPGLYIASRVSKSKQWRQRRRLFRRRATFTSADHARDFGCPADRVELLHKLLKAVHLDLGVPAAKLRADDRLDVELKIPLDKLHDKLVGEFMNTLEYMMAENFDVHTYPTAEFDVWACTLRELYHHLCHSIVTTYLPPAAAENSENKI